MGDDAWHSEALRLEAKAQTYFLGEFLADRDIRPDWREATWVCNVPRGPHADSISVLQGLQERLGTVNVTTGAANPPSPTVAEIGIYIRSDVLVDEPNFLRDYLSQP